MAQVDITPTDNIRMAGYAARIKPSTGIHDRLMAKAMAVEDRAGRRGLIISLDLIAISRAFADDLFELIKRRTGLARENIILNCSHTHSGPLLGRKISWVYKLSAAEMAVVQKYTDEFCRKLTALAVRALADMRPAQLSTHLLEDLTWQGGAGVVSFAMNRRRYTPDTVDNMPNPRGYVDRSVPVLRVTSPNGRLRGVFFGYSCHNTTLAKRLISADYAGYAQRLIEKRHRGVQAMFLQGCGADSNPWPRGTFPLARKHGTNLGAEVCRVLHLEFTPVHGPLKIAFANINLPLEPQPTPAALVDLRRRGGVYNGQMAKAIQGMIDSDKPWPKYYRTAFAVWQFGKDLTMVRMSGEVVSDYIPLLARTLGPLNLWVLGYCDDCFAYVPSERVYDEGGYEARDFISDHGFLSGSVERVILRKACALARRAGRPLPAAAERRRQSFAFL